MQVYITGGTGYLGRPLITQLLQRGHSVRALVRPGSEGRLPTGTEAVFGNALDASTFRHSVGTADVFVHLVGTPKPAPWKEREFRAVDLPAARAAIDAARQAKVRHFVYLSVAHPAPVMRAYIAVRQECEAYLEQSGMMATVMRPWYVLGPGHWWPYALLPFYKAAQWIPSMREGATRLGLVTHAQMVTALVAAAELGPAQKMRICGVPEIRMARLH